MESNLDAVWKWRIGKTDEFKHNVGTMQNKKQIDIQQQQKL